MTSISDGVHTTDIEVRFNELDPYNHVNHAVYVTYCEVARTAALDAVGLPLHEVSARGFQFVIVEIAFRYRGAAVAGETVQVDTTVVETKRASSRWAQRVRVGERTLVTAEVRVGLTDTDGRPTRPDPELFAPFDLLLAPDGIPW